MSLCDMFYPLMTGHRIQIVPDDLIYFLNLISLACFAMDDGAKVKKNQDFIFTLRVLHL